MGTRKSWSLALSAALLAAAAMGAGYSAPRLQGDPLQAALPSYPPSAREAIAAMTEEYGYPDFVSGRAIQWDDRGPFTRIMVFSHPTRHLFPEPHEDVLLQEVRVAVPADKAAALLSFDGSLLIDRTRGTLASRCDSEAANRLALNLAHDILEGQRDAASARAELARGRALTLSGKAVPDARRLRFTPRYDTRNLDAPVR